MLVVSKDGYRVEETRRLQGVMIYEIYSQTDGKKQVYGTEMGPINRPYPEHEPTKAAFDCLGRHFKCYGISTDKDILLGEYNSIADVTAVIASAARLAASGVLVDLNLVSGR